MSLQDQPRILVASELRNVDFNPEPNVPFARGGLSLEDAFDLLSPRAPMPVITAWGVYADYVYPWSAITSIDHYVAASPQGRDGTTRPERTSRVGIHAQGKSFTLRGRYMPMLEGLPQLLPRYAALAKRPLALDLEGKSVLPPWPAGGFQALLAAAKKAAEPLLENVSGYREHRAKVSVEGKATLARAITLEPAGADPGMLAMVIAATHGVTELADEIGACILSPNPLFAGAAKVAAGKLGMGPIVTGQLAEVAPFLYPQDVHALHAWEAQ